MPQTLINAQPGGKHDEQGALPELMLVRQLMTLGVPTCFPDTPVTEVARLMLAQSLEAVVVLDKEEGHALGVIGRQELVEAYARNMDGRRASLPDTNASRQPCASTQPLAGIIASAVMTETLLQVPADIPIQTAVQIMLDHKARVVFIMHQSAGVEYPVAYLTFWHALRHIAARDRSELSDLGTLARREAPLDAFIRRRDAARQKAGIAESPAAKDRRSESRS